MRSYDASLLDSVSQALPAEQGALHRARLCVEMPIHVRAALAADDDEAIIAAYDPALVRSFSAFTAGEQARIDLAFRRHSSKSPEESSQQPTAEILVTCAAVARIPDADDTILRPDRTYRLEVGIAVQQTAPEGDGLPLTPPLESAGFTQEAFTIPLPTQQNVIPFLLLARAFGLQIVGAWQQEILIDTLRLGPQIVTFTLETRDPGPAWVAVDFHYRGHWLQTLRFDLTVDERYSLAMTEKDESTDAA